MGNRLVKLTGVLFIGLLMGCMSYQDVELKGVESVKLNKISPQGIEMAIQLLIFNPNGYNITLKDANLTVTLNGTDYGEVIVDKELMLKKKSESSYTLFLKKEFKSLGGLMQIAGIMQLANAKQIRVEASGEAKAKAFMVSKRFPVVFNENVQL